MKELNLKLDVNEVNLILKSLSNLPYKDVSAIITKIHEQANKQLASNGHEKHVEETAS